MYQINNFNMSNTVEHCFTSSPDLSTVLFFSNLVQQWGARTDARTEYAPCGAPNVLVVEDLKPSSAYSFRLSCLGEDGRFGEPYPEVTFHTKKGKRVTFCDLANNALSFGVIHAACFLRR